MKKFHKKYFLQILAKNWSELASKHPQYVCDGFWHQKRYNRANLDDFEFLGLK